MNEITEAISKKVEGFEPDDGDQEAEFKGTEMVTLSQLLFKYSNCSDLIFFVAGVVCSFLFGSSLPAFCLVFGDMIDGMSMSTHGGGFDSLKE